MQCENAARDRIAGAGGLVCSWCARWNEGAPICRAGNDLDSLEHHLGIARGALEEAQRTVNTLAKSVDETKLARYGRGVYVGATIRLVTTGTRYRVEAIGWLGKVPQITARRILSPTRHAKTTTLIIGSAWTVEGK